MKENFLSSNTEAENTVPTLAKKAQNPKQIHEWARLVMYRVIQNFAPRDF